MQHRGGKHKYRAAAGAPQASLRHVVGGPQVAPPHFLGQVIRLVVQEPAGGSLGHHLSGQVASKPSTFAHAPGAPTS